MYKAVCLQTLQSIVVIALAPLYCGTLAHVEAIAASTWRPRRPATGRRCGTDGGTVAFKPRILYSAAAFAVPIRSTFDARRARWMLITRGAANLVGRISHRNRRPCTRIRCPANGWCLRTHGVVRERRQCCTSSGRTSRTTCSDGC
jgi:hypothetical protein